MVLADLGRKINTAFNELTKAPAIDEKVNNNTVIDDDRQQRLIKQNKIGSRFISTRNLCCFTCL